MLSKAQQKLITSLSQKKFRQKHGFFVAEGVKVIKEFLKSKYKLEALYTTADIFTNQFSKQDVTPAFITPAELKKISFLTTPQVAIALFSIPNYTKIKSKGINLVLDGVRDPGNMGTIIRECDWFGIKNIICSADTVDCYNPKVVQASMGSLARVKVHYLDVVEFLKQQNVEILGAFLGGENVYTQKNFTKNCFLVLGNEANGISPEVEEWVTKKVTIPRFGELRETESLNVAMAGAILLSELRRREL
ncbi:TrmH family RNA methyltransferase [Psychroflexus planctonicus]|uniref:RNA methyltransferase n=1 Tax=Psychroflexus planctonicus TaxID=1526575 RepID=A0ABQ1SF05_9FLAO|nr:RNA methyltransferase [Psychroflexus planctonicus]GGE27744.1 RNA methyltransferase [Psychroflexus planctonicus]